MSNEEERKDPRKTQQGFAVPSDRRREMDEGFRDTLPGTAMAPGFVQEHAATTPRCSNPENVVSSAPLESLSGTEQTFGTVSLCRDTLAEPFAREIIVRLMAQAGIELTGDYAFAHEHLLLILDGFDARTGIGYQYVSHTGQDVVSDFDSEAERGLEELSRRGIVHILVIHDHQVPTTEALTSRVEIFLACTT